MFNISKFVIVRISNWRGKAQGYLKSESKMRTGIYKLFKSEGMWGGGEEKLYSTAFWLPIQTWLTDYLCAQDGLHTPYWQKPNYTGKQLGLECILFAASYLDLWFSHFHFYSDLIITLHWFCMSLILTICLLLPQKILPSLQSVFLTLFSQVYFGV